MNVPRSVAPTIKPHCVTIHGQWMYPPEAVTRMAGLVHAGLLELGQFDVTSFGLDQANEAVVHAAAHAGPIKMTVIQP